LDTGVQRVAPLGIIEVLDDKRVVCGCRAARAQAGQQPSGRLSRIDEDTLVYRIELNDHRSGIRHTTPNPRLLPN